MSIQAFTLIAVAFSLVCLLLLALSDPKRARVSRRAQVMVLSAETRKALTILSILPTLVFVPFGLYAPLLLWLGSVLVSGWLLALLLPLFAEVEKSMGTSRRFSKIQK
ncbi:hypothetical protein [Litorivivens sp.]|uniref:hypothetical protein n=1 Tax=Litorivivens sp. TaxID=2020868 RepID=UPI00356428A5